MLKRLTTVFFIAMLFFQLHQVYACMPAGPDPWYKQQIEINKDSLPEGLSVSRVYIGKFGETLESRNTNWMYDTYKLENNSGGNIFVLKRNLENTPRSAETAFISPKYNIAFVLTPGESFVIDEKYYVSGNNFVQVYQDNRPLNTVAPAPQEIIVPVQYKDKTVEITGKATYALNNTYDPTLGAKGAEGCASFNSTGVIISNAVFVIAGAVLISLILVIFITVKLLVKHK